MDKIELLSPAGDFEGLKLAATAGADAVYFGCRYFNARLPATNFDYDMSDAIAFCHLYGVKCYLTLNTIIENEDINELIETIKNAISCGIDAFIVQDFGVLNIIKNCFKDVEIHASTQMGINNYLGSLRAKEMGISRVVLSRETLLYDIKLIKEKTGLDIEYFVQGALCVCFSGNCYLSSRLFNKSGNKGECKQPCRLPVVAYNGDKVIKSGYLLSAKDFNMSKRLKDLKEAGVNSFKIEGRLRRHGYIAGATSIYRNIIDNNFNVDESMLNNLKKLFNRGDYTEGYFNGNDKIIDYRIQGHKGILIGEIKKIVLGKKFNTIYISSNTEINKGDVLKIIKNDTECVITAMDIKYYNNLYQITTTSNLNPESKVYKIVDTKYENEILNIEKKLPLDFILTAYSGQKLKLEAMFKGKSFVCLGENLENAKTQSLGFDEAKTQLNKLGGTPFYLNDLKLYTDNVFVRKSELNGIRNNAIQMILDYYKQDKPVECNLDYLIRFNKYLNGQNILIDNACLTYEIGEKYDSSADILILRPSQYLAFNYDKIAHKNVFLYAPNYMSYKDIEVFEKILSKYPSMGIYADNIAFSKYKDRRIILGAKLNIKNIFAIEELYHKNVFAIMASPEISEKNYEILKSFSCVPVLKMDFSNFDIMTFLHCPIKVLFGNTCSDCKYSSGIKYRQDNGKFFKIKRYKIDTCLFSLIEG